MHKDCGGAICSSGSALSEGTTTTVSIDAGSVGALRHPRSTRHCARPPSLQSVSLRRRSAASQAPGFGELESAPLAPRVWTGRAWAPHRRQARQRRPTQARTVAFARAHRATRDPGAMATPRASEQVCKYANPIDVPKPDDPRPESELLTTPEHSFTSSERLSERGEDNLNVRSVRTGPGSLHLKGRGKGEDHERYGSQRSPEAHGARRFASPAVGLARRTVTRTPASIGRSSLGQKGKVRGAKCTSFCPSPA